MYNDFLDCVTRFLPRTVLPGLHRDAYLCPVSVCVAAGMVKKGNVKFEVHVDVKVNAQSSLSHIKKLERCTSSWNLYSLTAEICKQLHLNLELEL